MNRTDLETVVLGEEHRVDRRGRACRKHGVEPVPKLASIFGRLPAHELAIRRICTLDPDFKEVCEDYNEATAALLR